MKPTTIILISVALAVFLLVEGLIIYATSSLVPSMTEEIIISGKVEEKSLPDFSHIEFKSRGNIFLQFNESLTDNILIKQSDTVSSPRILMPVQLDRYVRIDGQDDNLTFTLEDPDNYTDIDDDGRIIVSDILVFNQPLTILTPVMPQSVIDNLETDITITGKADMPLTVNMKYSRRNLNIVDASLTSLTLDGNNSGYRPDFINSVVDTLIVKNFRRQLFIESDSLSVVNDMTIIGLPGYEQKFLPGSMTIKNFTFCPGDSLSSLNLIVNTGFTSSFN